MIENKRIWLNRTSHQTYSLIWFLFIIAYTELIYLSVTFCLLRFVYYMFHLSNCYAAFKMCFTHIFADYVYLAVGFVNYIQFVTSLMSSCLTSTSVWIPC